MTDRVWNRPIMHCKPLRIEFVMYAYRLCLLEMHESFIDITLVTYTKLAAKKVLEIFSLQILCLFWIKFLLDFYHLVVKWLLENLLILGPWLWQFQVYSVHLSCTWQIKYTLQQSPYYALRALLYAVSPSCKYPRVNFGQEPITKSLQPLY